MGDDLLAAKKIASPRLETGNSDATNESLLRFRPVLLLPLGLALLLGMRLRGTILRRCGLRALLLPVAELVLVVPRLGCASLLHWRRRLGLGMGPALRAATVIVLVDRALRGADAPVQPPAG